MNLIIEAGGTKSNLVFVNKGEVVASYTEPGIQLSRETLEDFEKKAHRWSELQSEKIRSIYLFAAGKVDAKKENGLKEIISKSTGAENIHLHSDLLAACYATAGEKPGIVGILGTGSNSCFYNGKVIVNHVSPGGFILGDEGSGSDIGKRVLIDFLRNKIPSDIKLALENEYKLTADLIIQNMYGGTVKDAANFCSGMASFVTGQLNHHYCHQICLESIGAYLQLLKENYSTLSNQLYLVGSVAFHLKELIKTEAVKTGLEMITIIQHPVNELSLFLARRDSL